MNPKSDFFTSLVVNKPKSDKISVLVCLKIHKLNFSTNFLSLGKILYNFYHKARIIEILIHQTIFLVVLKQISFPNDFSFFIILFSKVLLTCLL
ncbi:hypothetical protein HERIO_1683 [Hepatospora eriocheir]|uniref:Uncharacterized protein n=1 Tax=Hepatospora eriocheir TaxID=1081669 RepID=A0A1X0Q9L4_9MICR|nr:hypothetical protein HERIO_1683 [Hepatospora eriocheir]